MPYATNQYEGILAETIMVPGQNGDRIHAYLARPLGPGPFPGIVAIPHALGWTDYHKELVHKLAYHGYIALCPDIWCRVGHGTPEDVLARANATGGLPDAQVVGDVAGGAVYIRALPVSNGKVAVMGSCSGGRHSHLTATLTKGVFDAAINLWGGNVVQPKEKLTANQPVSPIEYTKDVSCPYLGLFGNDDQNPSPQQVDQLEAELKKNNKQYEFHRYDGAGHGFFYYHRPSYRPAQAVDGWSKVFDFLGKRLS